MTAAIEVASKAAVKIVVNAVSGGSSGGGGGVTAHSALTGLTTGDDHTQYQRSEAVFTAASPFTVTDESAVITTGSAVTLPSAQAMAGRTVAVGAAAVTVAISPAGTDTMFDDPGNPYSLPSGNGITFVAVEISAAWGWAILTRNGPAFDMPKWIGESVAAGEVLRMGASTPEWTNDDPGAYDFLSGAGWTDDVPVVIACKNTSAGTITKGQAVYVTGTVGATSVVEIALADCDDVAKMPAIGLAESTMAVNATGYVVVTGVLAGIDTSAFSINGPLYVSTTAGVLTGTKPTGTSELVQNIGRATRINASTGEVLVLGPGRTNDVPNAIDAGKLTSGTLDIARIADGAVTSAKIADGTIVNADVSASAAIATSKISGLATIATSGSASDLSAGTVPSARLASKVVGGQDEGAGVALSATPASLLDATITLPACAAGDLVLVAGSFTILNNSTASRTYTVNCKVGATTITAVAAGAVGNGVTRSFMFQTYLRVEGTSDLNATTFVAHSTGGGTSLVANAAGVATENIGSGSLALDLTVTSSTGTTTQTGTMESITVTRIAA